jgi:hypothetical protein
MKGRIRCVIELLARQQKLSARTSHRRITNRNRFGLDTNRYVVAGRTGTAFKGVSELPFRKILLYSARGQEEA